MTLVENMFRKIGSDILMSTLTFTCYYDIYFWKISRLVQLQRAMKAVLPSLILWSAFCSSFNSQKN